MTPEAGGVQQVGQAIAAPAKQKLCRACKLPMPADANKCTECSSLQDWRRYLDSSGIVLSLLVALTSVLTFAIPVWKDALVAKRADPTSALIDVDETGLATLVVTNGGNAPAVLENVLLGSDKSAVGFDLGLVPPKERVIEANGIQVFKVRLSVDNTVESVWSLVQIYRTTSGCELHVVLISPGGGRAIRVVDASTAGHDQSTDHGCALKLRKLTTMTLDYLGNREEYVPTLCKVAELHPRDPKSPPGTACRKS